MASAPGDTPMADTTYHVPVPTEPVNLASQDPNYVPCPGSGVTLLGTSSGELEIKSSDGTSAKVSSAGIEPSAGIKTTATDITFPATAASATVKQANPATDVSGAGMIISAQSGGTKSKSETVGGSLTLQTGAPGSGSSGTGGALVMKVGSAEQVRVTDGAITIAQNVAAPTISQATAAGDASGAALTIAAQTGGAKTSVDTAGGNLVLQSGAAGSGSSGAAGSVALKVGATQALKVDVTGLRFGSGPTVAKPVITGVATGVLHDLLSSLDAIGLITNSTTTS